MRKARNRHPKKSESQKKKTPKIDRVKLVEVMIKLVNLILSLANRN